MKLNTKNVKTVLCSWSQLQTKLLQLALWTDSVCKFSYKSQFNKTPAVSTGMSIDLLLDNSNLQYAGQKLNNVSLLKLNWRNKMYILLFKKKKEPN